MFQLYTYIPASNIAACVVNESFFLLFTRAELFCVPPNSLQGSFELLKLVRRDFGEGSSNISSVLPEDRDDELLATGSERDDTDAPVFRALDTGHESLTVQTVNRNTDRPRSEVHLRSDRIHREGSLMKKRLQNSEI